MTKWPPDRVEAVDKMAARWRGIGYWLWLKISTEIGIALSPAKDLLKKPVESIW